jgi:tyrosinase
VSPAVSPAPTAAPRALRHRRSARRLSAGQVGDLRAAITAAQAISASDDRSYQYWAGIHGLPLPEWCQHGSILFLPWHRAYLYFFERQLQDRVAGATLPWWDWTQAHDEGIPIAYSRKRTPDGKANPLASSPIQPSGRANPGEAKTVRQPHDTRLLPTPQKVEGVLENRDFFTFQTQLEEIHNGVHIWVGGTMHAIETAAYDPLFWAHHCMIDRLWYLWQLDHPGAGLPAAYLNQALPPFGMTVRQTLDITSLGYDYAAATAAVDGPGHG